MQGESLEEQFRRWRELELEHARRLAEEARRVRSPIVKAVLTAVSKDSEKHAALYEAALQLLGSGEVREAEFEWSLEGLRGHVETEFDAMKFLESLVEREDLDPQLRFILKLILRDERVHHVLLHDLYQALVRGELQGDQVFRELYRDLDRWA